MMRLKHGIKIGWVLVLISILLVGWVFFSHQSASADDAAIGAADADNPSAWVVPASVTAIDAHAFDCDDDYGITAYESIDIKGTVSVGDYAFAHNTNLNTLTIYGVTSWGRHVLEECGDLSSFNIGTGDYSVHGLAVYKNNGSGYTLVYVLPAADEAGSMFSIMDETTAIGDYAFEDSSVDTVFYPDSVTDINYANQGGWWPDTVVTASSSSPAYIQYTSSEVTNANKEAGGSGISVNTQDGSGGSTTTSYDVTVYEAFYDTDGTTLLTGATNPRTNSTLTGTYDSGSTITAATYDGFTVDSTTYTVSSSDDVTFNYTASSSGQVIPGSSSGGGGSSGGDSSGSSSSSSSDSGSSSGGGGGSSSDLVNGKYKIVIYDQLFASDGATAEGNPVYREVQYYTPGATYSVSAKDITGYGVMNASTVTGTITQNLSIVFKYKKGATNSTATTNNTTTTTTTATPGQPIKYTFTSGANQTVAKSAGIVSMTCDGTLDKFLAVQVDGVPVDTSNYATASGSTILAFTADYIASLASGSHTVRFIYTDGYADTSLTIAGKTTTTVTYTVSSDGTVSQGHTKDATPKTADGFDERYLLCLAIFLCGVGFLIYGKQKKLEIISAGRDE